MPTFNATSRRYTPEIALPRNLNYSSKVANWNIVDIFKYLIYYVITGISIRNGDYQRLLYLSTILYILSFNLRVVYHSN